MVMKKILIALALLLTGIASGSACTGISFLAEDGGYVAGTYYRVGGQLSSE